ncbi:MAG: J domain-containing protein [Vicinamibacterales bacterium]
MEFKDYYAALGLTKNATDAEIKRAFRKLARQHHPDLNPGDKKAEGRFKDINEANEVLSDPEKRRKYDELGANWRAYEQGGAPAGGPAGWAGPFGGAGGARSRPMTAEEIQEMFGGGGGDDGSFDFFHTFFGGEAAQDGARSRRAGRPAKGRDVEHPIDLTLDEAFAGTSRRIAMTREGQERTIEVRIPAGVKDGARVRAAGEGGQGGRGGQAGDLYLTVRVLPHRQFERRGQDLYLRIPVQVTTAVLGGEVSVPTIEGASVRLKVPELTAQGRTFRLRGHGMPSVGKPAERGDLYATVDIQIPDALSEPERTHYQGLKTIADQKH